MDDDMGRKRAGAKVVERRYRLNSDAPVDAAVAAGASSSGQCGSIRLVRARRDGSR
ncbi:hypothetical protein ACVOMT_05565 [Sphingomonas panni]|uniref:hypothetical protein n=1 Tax=Sphingomonas panni TaxID=237612 RepID=UPI001F5B0AAD|nr:hypothetical protein [Sphingomonas panni]